MVSILANSVLYIVIFDILLVFFTFFRAIPNRLTNSESPDNFISLADDFEYLACAVLPPGRFGMKEITYSLSFLLDSGVDVAWGCFLTLLAAMLSVKEMSLVSFVKSMYCFVEQILELLLLAWDLCDRAFGESRIMQGGDVSIDVTSIIDDLVLLIDLSRSVFISLVFPKVLK